MSKLRPYQQEASDAVIAAWEENATAMIVMPTGCGKTQVFTDIIRRCHPKRALVLAHREELIWQARNRIEQMTGLGCEVEMADLVAAANLFVRGDVIVSTVQTQNSGPEGKKRMTRFSPDDFGLLVVDECHHVASPSYRAVIDYYKQNKALRVLGVTATPDRADEKALGQVFECAPFSYEMLDAIHDGWLVPIDQQMVTIDGLDFSSMRTTAGDLNGADLSAVMEAEKNLHGMASATMQIIGNRRTIVFTVSVKQAEMLSNIFNRHKENCSDWVCGATNKDDRREKLAKFSDGRIQIMVNCGVLTEGYDNPGVGVIVMARPTKSRSLYSQMVGRATRALPGLVDPLPTSEERKEAIRASDKPSCLVVDFVGNSGRHKLITSADLLGGKVSDEAVERAIAKAKKEGKAVRMSDLLDQEQEKLKQEADARRRQEEARKARLVGNAKFTARVISPFDVFQITPEKERGWDTGKTLSEKQRSLLLKQGINPDSMPHSQSKQILNEMFRRWGKSLASLKQCEWLRKKGYDYKDMTKSQASKIMDSWAKNNWQRPPETSTPASSNESNNPF